MVRYIKAPDIWTLTDEQRAKLQPGQWVYAGPFGDTGGRFLGQGRASTVVAWQGNRRATEARAYESTLRTYAQSIAPKESHP